MTVVDLKKEIDSMILDIYELLGEFHARLEALEDGEE